MKTTKTKTITKGKIKSMLELYNEDGYNIKITDELIKKIQLKAKETGFGNIHRLYKLVK